MSTGMDWGDLYFFGFLAVVAICVTVYKIARLRHGRKEWWE